MREIRYAFGVKCTSKIAVAADGAAAHLLSTTLPGRWTTWDSLGRTRGIKDGRPTTAGMIATTGVRRRSTTIMYVYVEKELECALWVVYSTAVE